MKINGKNSLRDFTASFRRLEELQQPHRSRKTGQNDSGSDADRVELSSRIREIQHLDDLIRSTPDIRETKVEEVRSAIKNGTYYVKAEKIAEKILGGNLVDEVF